MLDTVKFDSDGFSETVNILSNNLALVKFIMAGAFEEALDRISAWLTLLPIGGSGFMITGIAVVVVCTVVVGAVVVVVFMVVDRLVVKYVVVGAGIEVVSVVVEDDAQL